MAAAVLLSACGGRSGPERPTPRRAEAFARPLEIYRDLGFMTGPGQFPVVASFSTLAGPADSTWVLLSLSIPNSALRFQRDGSGFVAEYDVNVMFMDADSVTVKQARTRESVRIPSFNETGRTDESVVHQQGFTVPPGSYIVRLQAEDAHSSRGFRMTDTITAPAYGAAQTRLSAPILVYQATGRSDRESLPTLITNPRHTVPYGGAAPVLYIESYGGAARSAEVRVLGESGAVVWSGMLELVGGDTIRHGTVEIPAESLPLGRFDIQVDADGTSPQRGAPLVMTISDQWMVSNFDEVLQFLRLIARPAELDSLQQGTTAERREAWERFWAARDPLPVTAINEYRDEFFQRVRYAAEAFRELGGRAGWNTDRGEVYIVLGAPDHVRERQVGSSELGSQANAEEWVYNSVAGGRLTLLFHDRAGFGRYELAPSSAAAFRSVAERLRRQPERR